MKCVLDKNKIRYYSELLYNNHSMPYYEAAGDVNENEENEKNVDFEENAVYTRNCFESVFEQIDSCRFGNFLLVEIQKLGDYDGYYNKWAMKVYLETMKNICDEMDGVLVTNYEYDDNDEAFRAFFVSFLFDIDYTPYFEDVYKYCKNFCTKLDVLTHRKLSGCYWDSSFETDEMAFCEFYLTPFFKKSGFENVIFNHGNKEFGKDYILETKDIFGYPEYYGVQAKAGNLSGKATSNINEIVSQINMAFKVPYKATDGTEVYISKIIIAISGVFSENAQSIIQNTVDRYMFSNIIFLSKKELENHQVMT